MEGAVNKAVDWYDISQGASKEEYEQKQTEIEAIVKYVCIFLLSLTSEIFLLFPLLQALSYKDSTLTMRGAHLVCSLVQTNFNELETSLVGRSCTGHASEGAALQKNYL